jgi:proteasome accessory factor B
MKRSARIKQLEDILREHPDGLRVIELSKLCGVDRRTIYRDLQDMQRMGIPLWQAQGRFGIEREQYLTSLPINLNEAVMLLWALRLMNLQTESENPHRRSLIKKIIYTLPPELSDYLKTVRDAFPDYPLDNREVKVIENVTRAWADSLKVLIWYQSPGKSKPSRRVIAPYFLDTTPQGSLFVIGLEDHSREPRIFNLHRISRAEVLEDEPFHRAQSIDLRKYLTAAYDFSGRKHPQTVVLRFKPEAVSAVMERQWYPGQQVDVHEDGSCIYIAEVMDWHEMEKWVRSWGAQVEVIAPASFRKTIAAEYRQAARLYG